MIHFLTIALFFLIAFTLPPAVKVLAVVGMVYAAMVALKKAFPAISGWKAVALNIILSVAGYFAPPYDPTQFYTLSTLQAVVTIIITALGAAGIHGTVASLSPPTVLAKTPDGSVKNVPATVQPVDPADTKIDTKR